jgi:hypothetical protein
MTVDHKEIWLECKCGDFSYEGRQWCQDDAFDSSDHGPECKGSVKYIRADLHEALTAENERLAAAVRKLLACPAIADGNHNEPAWACPETAEAEREGRAAVERKPE